MQSNRCYVVLALPPSLCYCDRTSLCQFKYINVAHLLICVDIFVLHILEKFCLFFKFISLTLLSYGHFGF